MAKSKRAPAKASQGINFPVNPDGSYGSTFGGHCALVEAARAVSDAEAERVQADGGRRWRSRYLKHVLRQVELSLESPDQALAIAETGLKWAHDNFEFHRDGKKQSLAQAMQANDNTFETAVIKGEARDSHKSIEVPYRGRVLRGEEISRQVDKWASAGTIEPSCAANIKAVVKNEAQWCDLSNKYFVLLGAGSAMGPIQVLSALGANIIAVDLDRSPIWARLTKIIKSGRGTMYYPKRSGKPAGQSEEGCNLFTDTPEIRQWVSQTIGAIMAKNKSVEASDFTIGAYAYLDGALHVKVSLAMDAIIAGVQKDIPGVGCAYLCTPSDAHCIPEEAWQAAKKNYASLGSLIHKTSVVNLLKGALKRNVHKPVKGTDGQNRYLVDGLVNKQGPNYALAKRIQHWRAIVAHSANNHVSSNIAPSTRTVSVTSNKLFALAYNGMHWFTPMEVFEPETSNAVMGALLIHDVNNKASVAFNSKKLSNPHELFKDGSFHGGVWRCGYTFDSIGEQSIMLALLQQFGLPLLAIAAVVYAVFLQQ